MDKKLFAIYGKFVKNRVYDRALDVLELAYQMDGAGTYEVVRKYRDGLTALAKRGNASAMVLLRRAYLLTARDCFDDFCIFLEWDRPIGQRFYMPRRKQLLPIVQQLQRLSDDKIDRLCVSCPPGIGKSALAQFFLLWLAGRDPDHGILSASHNASFVRGMYEEFLRELDEEGEYNFYEVFPERKVVKTNALDLKIDLDRAKKFSTLQHTSIGAQNAGRFRAIQLLYCDDLVEGIEEALSNERLDAKWQKLSVDLLQRAQGGCKLLVIMTRWSVRDPIGRLKMEYENDPRTVFLSMPALNKDDKSNFDYGGHIGFSTKFYHNLRNLMDEASWNALYMNTPVERSGVLFQGDELRRFFDLPSDEPDATWAVCDTKNKGDDYFCMPVAYQYGDDFYITDILCDNKEPRVVEPRLVNLLINRDVKQARFESNSAGGRIAQSVQDKIKEKDGITKITTKYSTANKDTRIMVDSSFIKEHFLFRSPDKYDAEYRLAMGMLTSYTMSGKNRHDDVPDALSMLANLVQGHRTAIAQVIKRPF